MSQTPTPRDGRHRRSADSRRRIVQALLDLVREGDLSPSAETVAERAGVGLRSVFRHFQDMESLRREMSLVVESQIGDLLERPFEGATWRARLGDLVVRRAMVFERVMPYRRAGLAHAHKSDFVTANIAHWNQIQRATLSNLLPKDLSDLGLCLDALDLVLSLETWIRLRRDQGLEPQRAEAVMAHLVASVLDHHEARRR